MKKIMFLITGIFMIVVATTIGAIMISNLINKCDPEPQNHVFINYHSYQYSAYVSWYGRPFHGRTMANGEKYNMHSPDTAAHKTLPFGTKVKATNLNGQSTNLVIKDRGPYILGREFDLSYAAAKKLGLIKDGVALVKVEIFTNEKFYFYKIKSKETLWRLFGPKWTRIAKINNIRPEEIKKGTKIIVPYKF